MNEILTDKGPRAVPQSILVISAHPDDVDFGAAGTVAALTAAGSQVVYCMVTSGEAGDDNLDLGIDQLRELRENEQRLAAKEVGVEDIHFLRFPDGAVESNLGLRRALSRVIRQVRPDLVISQSPERNYDRIYASHPDHLAAGEAALCAVYPDARNPRAFTELLEEGHAPHVVGEVWLMAHVEGDLCVDVTDTFEAKMAALRAHRSQTSDHADLAEMIRGWLSFNAEQAGMVEGRLAESFRVVETA